MNQIPVVQIPTQSHSSLDTFMTCPRMYQAKYVTREVKFKPTLESRWGDNAHHHLEIYVESKGTCPIPEQINPKTGENMRDYQWAGDAILARAEQKNAQVLVERKFGIGHNRQTNGYFDKLGYLRGKIDVTLLYDNVAETFDYKTGKKKSDPDQLVMYNASALLDYPQVEVVRGGYIWLKEPPAKAIDKPLEFTRQNLPDMFAIFDSKYARVRHAYEKQQFPPKKGPLCGWCDVESCEFQYVSEKKAASLAMEQGS